MNQEVYKIYLEGLSLLLEIKDCDIRILTLEQCRESVDKGMHAGGAFSAVIPLVALFYGGFMDFNVEHPTHERQDMFVLSKGHAIATLASIYADLGYFGKEELKNSRSIESRINGHPGPILPGIHISTGPLGQGIGVAQGFAIHLKQNQPFNVFCMTGDGELQEGIVWETIMFSAYKQLDNFCVLVDRNFGQLDTHEHLVFPLENLEGKFESFGWNVINVNAMSYRPVVNALEAFTQSKRNGKPTAIICNTYKGFGAFNSFLNRHKIEIPDEMMKEELSAHNNLRNQRVDNLITFIGKHENDIRGREANLILKEKILSTHVSLKKNCLTGIQSIDRLPLCSRAEIRSKKIKYKPSSLPVLETGKSYTASQINTMVMNTFAEDPKIVSIDADLSSTSGLEAGIRGVDAERALNVGVAEANMMNIGEAYAVLGYNVFVSTFCPFFEWKVLRRIAIGYQERMEDIESDHGWLNEGHGLDITFVATAPNLESRTNGATHMGNDDITFFSSLAHLKIIDISCPQQQIAVLRWIAEGNKGLVYMRVMRSGSDVIYNADYKFEYGKGVILRNPENNQAWIISSGRGTHEALSAADTLQLKGYIIGVADMPTVDEDLLLSLYDSGKPILVAEQNNGYIWSNLIRLLLTKRDKVNTGILFAVNTLTKTGFPRFIHSGTYYQLTLKYGLDAESLSAKLISVIVKKGRNA